MRNLTHLSKISYNDSCVLKNDLTLSITDFVSIIPVIIDDIREANKIPSFPYKNYLNENETRTDQENTTSS